MHNLFSETKARVKNKIQRNIDKNNNFSKMHTGTVGSGALCVMFTQCLQCTQFSEVLLNICTAHSFFHLVNSFLRCSFGSTFDCVHLLLPNELLIQ